MGPIRSTADRNHYLHPCYPKNGLPWTFNELNFTRCENARRAPIRLCLRGY